MQSYSQQLYPFNTTLLQVGGWVLAQLCTSVGSAAVVAPAASLPH